MLGPCMSLGRGAPACQLRQSVRTAGCWELVHLGALDDGSATHLLRHTGGRASARRSAPTHPTAPIPQDHLRHAFGPARTAGAADLESASEARTAQRQPSGTDGCISSDTCIHRPASAPVCIRLGCPLAALRGVLKGEGASATTAPKCTPDESLEFEAWR